jgi:hypothetical protein
MMRVKKIEFFLSSCAVTTGGERLRGQGEGYLVRRRRQCSETTELALGIGLGEDGDILYGGDEGAEILLARGTSCATKRFCAGLGHKSRGEDTIG